MKFEKDIISIGEILFDCYPDYKVLGGAPFNFIYHVWRLTGKGKFISKVGDDELGNEIMEYLNSENFDTGFILKDEKYKTGKVQVKLNKNKIPEYIIEENAAYDFIELSADSKKYAQNEAGLIYYGTLAQRNKITRNTVKKLFSYHAKYFYDVNLRQNFYSEKIIETSLKKADIVKLNEEELKIINSLLIQSGYDLIETSQTVLKEFEIELLCVTLGEEGALLFKKGEINKYKHSVENIVDTVGAGDAYSAILCLGYLLGWGLNKINTLASEFAAEICKIKGAIPEDKNFYQKYLEIIENE